MPLLTKCCLVVSVAWAALGDDSRQASMPVSEFRQTATGVRDYTEVTASERLSYFRLLAGIRQLGIVQRPPESDPPVKTNGRAVGNSQFADIYRHPEEYRGKLVRIGGYVRELSEWDAAADNDQGLTTLYQAWVFTEDSFSNPYVVVCSEVSPGLRDQIRRQGKQAIKERVEVVGVFFKIWKYEARDGTRGAPMILAHRLEWKPTTAPQSSGNWIWIGITVLVFVVFPGTVLAIQAASRKDREFRERRLQSLPSFTPQSTRES
jgi:hypothetical protein